MTFTPFILCANEQKNREITLTHIFQFRSFYECSFVSYDALTTQTFSGMIFLEFYILTDFISQKNKNKTRKIKSLMEEEIISEILY